MMVGTDWFLLSLSGSGGLAILPGLDDSHPQTEFFFTALPYNYALGGEITNELSQKLLQNGTLPFLVLSLDHVLPPMVSRKPTVPSPS
jgi:hypothetical protein